MINIEKIIKEIIEKYIDKEQTYVFLFGSRATKKFRPASDYDVGIYSGKPIPLKTIALIKDELENYPIPVDVDIIDFYSTSEKFRKLAAQRVKIWHKPKKSSKQTLPF